MNQSKGLTPHPPHWDSEGYFLLFQRQLLPMLLSCPSEFSVDVFWFQCQREISGDRNSSLISVVRFDRMKLMTGEQQQISCLRNNRPGVSVPLIESRDTGFVVVLPIVVEC